jgi:hypothetical protein
MDVVVRIGDIEPLSPEAATAESGLQIAPEDVRFFRKGVGTFRVCGGHEIIVAPASDVGAHVLRPFILGPALAVLLHQRGRLVLHASAVAVNGRAVAFLGGSGWGKSTMAGALRKLAGHAIVTDDVLALDVGERGQVNVYPGFPQLKLWPEVAVSLGDVPETLPLVHPLLKKRCLGVASGFSVTPLPLGRVYVLVEGEAQVIEALRPQEALVELIRHSFAPQLLTTADASKHFTQCARLADSASFLRLKRPRALEALPSLVRWVEEDLAQIHG